MKHLIYWFGLGSLVVGVWTTQSPVTAQINAPICHTVQRGDSLYSISRRYGVSIDAIRTANGLNSTVIQRGQVLCFGGTNAAAPTAAAPTAAANIAVTVPAPAPTAAIVVANNGTTQYVVQRGDNLYRIALRFGTTIANIQKANRLTGTNIYAGQVLVIPNQPVTIAPTTAALPPTAVPTTAALPPTAVPTTAALPPTAVPPTAALPPTAVPPTAAPTNPPALSLDPTQQAMFDALQVPMPVYIGPASMPIGMGVANRGQNTVQIGTYQNQISFTIPLFVRDIYRNGQALGNNARAFSKLGDCHSAGGGFVQVFGGTQFPYNLGGYGQLQRVINYYKNTSPNGVDANSFTYVGEAAQNGFNAIEVHNPTWAPPQRCNKEESPLRCELRRIKPAIAIAMFGTADVHFMHPAMFERGLRQLVEDSLRVGTIPVLTTFPEVVQYRDKSILFNLIIKQIGLEYQVPVLDLHAALQFVQDKGVEGDGVHLKNVKEDDLGANLSDQNLSVSGVHVRNLLSLQALDAILQTLGAY